MKIYKKFIGICLIFAFAVGIGLMIYNSKTALASIEPQWLVKKQSALSVYNARIKENSQKQFARPQPNYDYLKAPIKSIWDKTGVFKIEQGFQFPFSSTIQSQFDFTNIAYTPFDLLIAGSSTSNTSNGVIIDLKVDPKTMQDSKINFNFAGVGAITLTDVRGDIVCFSTSTGKVGEFNVTTGKYVLK